MPKTLSQFELKTIAVALDTLRTEILKQPRPPEMSDELWSGIERYICAKADELERLRAKVNEIAEQTP